MPVPDRFEERIRKSEVQDVLDGFLSKVMVDPENRRFVEHAAERSIQFSRGAQIAAEGFLDDDTRVAGAIRLREVFDDRRHQTWRNRQVVRRTKSAPQLRSQAGERSRIGVVPLHVLQLRRQPGKGFLVFAAVFADRCTGPGDELIPR